MTNAEHAVEMFKQGLNCSQAVFSAFAPSLGMDAKNALKTASGFGGGMGMMGDTCGAVTGAFMALGLKFGHLRAEDQDAKRKTYGLVKEFAARFEARNGSIVCRKLLGFDLGTPDGMNLAVQRDVHHTVCPKFVRDAAEILEELL